jgi:serum/glucocorticoid-regulated kinase 2
MIVKDELEVAKKANLKSLLGKNEKIIFSATLTKINKNQKYQERNIMITSSNFYNLRSDGMLASVTSLFNSTYMIKRKFDLKLVKAIVYAKLGNEFVVHVPSEFDYRLISERYDRIDAGKTRLLCTYSMPCPSTT